MEWTPMVSTAMFDGIKADMITAAGCLFALGIIVFGLFMLMKPMR